MIWNDGTRSTPATMGRDGTLGHESPSIRDNSPPLKQLVTALDWTWPQRALKISLVLVVATIVALAAVTRRGETAGNTEAPSSHHFDAKRASDIVAYVNTITLSGRVFEAPEPLTLGVTEAIPSEVAEEEGKGPKDLAIGGNKSTSAPSHEELALQWLIYQDPLQLRPHDSPMHQFRFRQRYALLSLYSSVGQMSIVSTVDDECQWGGQGHDDDNQDVPRVVCTLLDLGDELGWQNAVTAFGAHGASGVLSMEIGILTRLTYLSFHGSGDGVISTTLPSTLGLLAKLNVLVAPSNDLTGTIPESLARLTHLQELRLGTNRLTGTIPESFGQLTNLKTFQVYENALTGTIPESIERWSNVQDVQFGHNSFSGTMPASLGHWTTLVYFGVEDNQMTGTLPEYIGVDWIERHQLQYATFHHNNFVGNIMINQTCDSAELQVLSADCLSPSNVTCRCCTSCY